jgi:hypothetical protein
VFFGLAMEIGKKQQFPGISKKMERLAIVIDKPIHKLQLRQIEAHNE